MRWKEISEKKLLLDNPIHTIVTYGLVELILRSDHQGRDVVCMYITVHLANTHMWYTNSSPTLATCLTTHSFPALCLIYPSLG